LPLLGRPSGIHSNEISRSTTYANITNVT
jgi:hypothetical protein